MNISSSHLDVEAALNSYLDKELQDRHDRFSPVANLQSPSPLLEESPILRSENQIENVRRYRYDLQSLAAELLPRERVSQCLRSIAPSADSVQVLHHHGLSTHTRFRNLVVCGRVWTCPVCASRISEERRRELSLAAGMNDLSPMMVTFTLRHKREDRLDRVLSALLEAVRAFKSGRYWQRIKKEYGVAGSVRSLEVTYSDENGWHPHCHMLLFVYGVSLPRCSDEQLDKVKVGERPPAGTADALEYDCRQVWLKNLQAQGFDATWENGLTVTSQHDDIQSYIAKFGREPRDLGWTPTHELTKGHLSKKGRLGGHTPFQLLEAYGQGNKRAGRLFVEYAQTFKGRNQLVWSRGLRGMLGLDENSDEKCLSPVADLLDDVQAAEAEVLITLSRLEWKFVLAARARCDLLEAAALPDVNEARERANRWVAALMSGVKVTYLDLNRLMDAPDPSTVEFETYTYPVVDST